MDIVLFLARVRFLIYFHGGYSAWHATSFLVDINSTQLTTARDRWASNLFRQKPSN
jgi:hypothetical protein